MMLPPATAPALPPSSPSPSPPAQTLRTVTRAVENGFATRFTKGDQIGLYVAKATLNNSGSPDRFDKMLHENLCLTYDGT